MYIQNKGHIIAAGFVGRDAEYKEFDWGVVCNFSIKVDEEPVPGEDKPKAKWLSVTTRGEVARYAAVIAKGNSVVVCGRLKQRSYTGRDGEQKTVTELHAEFVQIQPDAMSLNGFADGSAADFTELSDDNGDVPF